LNTISNAIAGLKADWHTLNDLDRAEAVLRIIRTGVSRRSLATALGVSESTIRLTLLLLEAGFDDQALFLESRISRNELLRRVKGISPASEAEPASSPIEKEVSKAEHNEEPVPWYTGITDSAEACEEILEWFRRVPLRGFHIVQTLKEARTLLDRAEAADDLPRDRAPAGMSSTEIARCCQPNREDFPSDVAWYARWLALSAFHIIPNDDVRRDALDITDKRISEVSTPATFGRPVSRS